MKKSLLLVLFAIASTLLTPAMAQTKPVAKAKTTTRTTVKRPVVKKPIAKPTAAKPKAVIDKSIRLKITTDSGIIIVKLYDSTPLHRDNFVKLAKEKFFDSLLFHRVIPEFMIQGGDPESRYAQAGMQLGGGGGDLGRIPAEFRRSLIHKKGALAAARDNNPEKASSACQFYLVEGKTFSDAELTMMEQRQGRKYTAEQRNIYKTIGGTPFLDMEYTVFGEIVSGLNVISKISHVPQDGANRPTGDIRMKIEVIK